MPHCAGDKDDDLPTFKAEGISHEYPHVGENPHPS
jgi:hypothetical protein